MPDETTKKNKSRKARKTVNGRGQLPDVEWVNPSPNAADLKWLVDSADQLPALVLELFDDMGEKERMSLKVDAYSGRWCAIYFGGNGDSVNQGLALSVRGATPYDALCLLAYFHVVRYARDWDVPPPSVIGRWG